MSDHHTTIDAPNETLAAREELIAALLENTVDGIIAYTPIGELVYANKAAEAQWGASFDEMQSRGLYGWVAATESERNAARTERIVREGSLRFESTGTTDDGSPYAIETHSRFVETSVGPLIISNVRDVSDRYAAEQMVRYLAYHDNLTGLANRVMLEQELVHAVAMSERHGDVVGLIYLDLDGFKPVNDRYGHFVGDQVLREIANRISGAVRETDVVARPGGDEFVVLFPRLSMASDLDTIAHTIQCSIERPVEVNSYVVELTASAGLAIHEKGEPAEAFLARADLAMYASRDRDGAESTRATA